MVSLNCGVAPELIGNGNLVLSFHREDEAEIWDDQGNVIAIVKLTEIRGDKVRIAFRAPKHIPIHRHAVAEAIRAERQRGNVSAK